MKIRPASAAVVLAVITLALGAELIIGKSYAEQHRDEAGARPSRQHPLGTDDLGRDRLARLAHASSVSLVLALAASTGALVLAGLVGGFAGYLGGATDAVMSKAVDLMNSLPWLLLLLTARALLPLNAGPAETLMITYGLLAVLGWASPARVVRAGVMTLCNADFVLRARAQGCPEGRILVRHVLPGLKPVFVAQFWTSIPVFILAEANLGLLGLSAGEPFPTWGSLLRELQNPLLFRPEAFAPLAAVSLALLCFKIVLPMESAHL